MTLRKATLSELPVIWEILQQAIAQRKQEGSMQWQNGYPNPQVIQEDIAQGYGYVLVEDEMIIAYSAIIFGVESAYNDIIGQWLTHGDYVVVHRVATANAVKGRGVGTHLLNLIADLCITKKVFSIKIDTNFDNKQMLRILEKIGYTYCGEVFLAGASRMAYEKVLLTV
jgi:GNAT superfamily N-acetyltransferase